MSNEQVEELRVHRKPEACVMIEGYGGKASNLQFSEKVLDGILADDVQARIDAREDGEDC